jgi:phosphate-selective porin OprO/OprP
MTHCVNFTGYSVDNDGMVRTTLALVVCLALSAAAPAQTTFEFTPPEKGSSPKETEPGKPAEAGDSGKSEKPPITAGWDDGFLLRSADKNFVLRFTGQIQADFRGYLDARDTTDVPTFLVRRARLGIEATVAEIYEFRLLPDFGQGVARVFDSYMNVHFRDAFQVEIGKFKQPFSYEQLIQDRYVPTMERSIIDFFAPARDIGLMVHGQKLFDDRLDYYASISNGQINGDLDLAPGVDGNFRLVGRPFAQAEAWPLLKRLQVGVSATVGDEEEPINPATLRTPANIPWFTFNVGVRARGVRWRYSPEAAWFYKGFGLAGQYFHMEQWMRAAPAAAVRQDVHANGFYVMATWLLTGEERTTYSQAIAPLRPFDIGHPLQSPGALEAVFRLSRVQLSDNVFVAGPSRLADPTKFSPGATETTVGYNWYWTKWARTQFNWEHSWFDSPVLLGTAPAGALRIQNTLLTRFQVIF